MLPFRMQAMDLELQRSKGAIATLGHLLVDGVAEYFTLEPLVPIPAGRYQVIQTPYTRVIQGKLWSPDIMDRLPLLVDVPDHTGFNEELPQSRDALTTRMAKLREPIHLTIKDAA